MSERPSRFRPLHTLDATARLLRTRANRYAWIGLSISSVAIVLATLLVCRYEFNEYSLSGMLAVQQRNPALWLLDTMPLVFLIWGQYIGVVMSYTAGAMVLDETRELRQEADRLEYELGRAPVLGHNLGLPNRHALIAAIDRAISQHDSNLRGAFSVIALDTQHYHEIEQSLGEEAVRQYLNQLRERLQGVIGETDVLAHFGFDDFGILLGSATDEAEAKRQASRVQLALDLPISLGRRPLSVRSSVGIACFPKHGEDSETLVRHAETAKYAATAQGQDALVYDPSQDNVHAQRSRLMAELHSALYNEGLTESFWLQQPLQDDEPLRMRFSPYWDHPREGRMEENQFIDLPDRLGLVHGLSLWVLRQGLERLTQWLPLEPSLKLVLRLPAAALRQLSLPELVLRLLSAHDLQGASLILEFPGQTLGTVGQDERKQLAALRQAGVGISLDGVGEPRTSPLIPLFTECDSTRVIGRIPHLAVESTATLNAARALVQLLHALRQTVVIEGVESQAHLELCRSIGADYAQGPAVLQAMSGEAGERWLRQRQPA